MKTESIYRSIGGIVFRDADGNLLPVVPFPQDLVRFQLSIQCSAPAARSSIVV